MDVDALRLLKYAFAAVDLGSMRKAAAFFGVRQSSVSRNIGKLEQAIGIQIFERRNNGVRLTREGRNWLGEIRTHYDGLQHGLIEIARRNRDPQTLRIGLASPACREFLIRLITRFRKTHPDIELTILDVASERLSEAMHRRELDVAFTSERWKSRACRTETVWEEGLSVLLPAEHRLAGQEALSWSNLVGETLLVPVGMDAPQFDPFIFEQISAGGGGPIIRQCRASQVIAMLDVQLGEGMLLTCRSLVSAVGIDGTVWIPIVGENSICPIKVVWLESNPKRAVLRFVAVARKNSCRNGSTT